jgi:hypothetical protein
MNVPALFIRVSLLPVSFNDFFGLLDALSTDALFVCLLVCSITTCFTDGPSTGFARFSRLSARYLAAPWVMASPPQANDFAASDAVIWPPLEQRFGRRTLTMCFGE